MGLAVQFLLGMAVNLLGLPAQTTGAAHAATLAFLAAHIVVSAGMLAGAFMVVRAATQAGRRRRAYEYEDPPWHYVTVSPPVLLGARENLNARSGPVGVSPGQRSLSRRRVRLTGRARSRLLTRHHARHLQRARAGDRKKGFARRLVIR